MFLNRLYSKALFNLWLGRYNRIYKSNHSICDKSQNERARIKTFYNIQYISRELACLNIELDEELIEYLLYTKNNNIEQYIKTIKKLENKQTNSGIIDRDGFIENDKLHKLKLKVKMLDDTQNYYKLVLNFSSKIVLEARLYNYKNINRVIDSFINIYFERQKLDQEKLYWFYSIHTNSNSYHIHLFYFETEPSDCYFAPKKSKMVVNYLELPIFYEETLAYMRTKIRTELLLIKKEYEDISQTAKIYQHKTLINNYDPNYKNYTWFDLRQVYTDIKFIKNKSAKHAHNFIEEMKKNNLGYEIELEEIDITTIENLNLFVNSIITNIKLPGTQNELLNNKEDCFSKTNDYQEIKNYVFNRLMSEYKKHTLIKESRFKNMWTYLKINVRPVYNKIFFIDIKKIEQKVEKLILKYYFNNNIKQFSKIILNDLEEKDINLEEGEIYAKEMK